MAEILITDVIKKKRCGEPNSRQEIEAIVLGFTNGSVPDYQVSAWLMAVLLKGMNDEETHHLTQVMLHSGVVMDFSDVSRPKIDKHSTGGIGDKTTLLIGPIVSSCGVAMPTISGRGLAHTGGTLDKLESIPGFETRLDTHAFRKILDQEGLCFMGQTEEICPADKKIYALRDVTSTVDSFPLICASIMSKKLAEGIDGLVLDVKVGSGAFMKTEDRALELAQRLINIGERAGTKVVAVLTNMDEPLGAWIGNAVEVEECLKILRNEKLNHLESKTRELSLILSAHMIQIAGLTNDFESAYAKALSALTSLKALEKFESVARAHKGDISALPRARYQEDILATESGRLAFYDSEEIGKAAIVLRAGRKKMTDTLDYAAGIQIHKSIGDSVEKGEPLFTLRFEDKKFFEEAQIRLLKAHGVSNEPVAPKPLIIRTLSK